jgi:TRAP transporter TAXI family solute receptor
LGVGISRIVHANLSDVEMNMIPNISSFVNAKAIGRVDGGFGIVQSDIAYYALKGLKPLFEKPIPNIRGIASLYPETLHIFARKDAKINSVSDLRGKRVAIVAVGEPKSGPDQNAMEILEVYGIRFEDLGKVEWLTINEGINFLKDNKIDAFFLMAVMGSPDPARAISQPETMMVPIDDAHVDALMKKHSQYARGKIPAGVYKGIDAEISTISVWMIFAVKEELQADIVYRITRAFFENTAVMSAAHGLGKQVKLENALRGMSIPLHPGAEKFYKEKGMIK